MAKSKDKKKKEPKVDVKKIDGSQGSEEQPQKEVKVKKDKKKKIKVEKVGSPKKETKKKKGSVPQDKTSLELLREEAIALGMLKKDAEKFESEELLQSTIDTLKAVKASATAPTKEKLNPKEERATEKRWRGKAEKQKAYFDSLIPVRMLIPCLGEEKPGVVEEKVIDGIKQTVVLSGAVWSKTFNGYKVIIPKGVYTNVSGVDPETDKIAGVAKNIQDEFSQVQKSNERFSVDRIDPKTGRPVKDQL